MSKSPKSTAKSVKAITTKKVGDVIVNRGKGLKEPKFTKAAKYQLSSTIDDSMKGAATSGKAGAGQIVAVFNHGYFKPKKLPNGKPYNPIQDYFTAPDVDEKDDDGKIIRMSRKSIQDYYLSTNSAHYKKVLSGFNHLTAKYNEVKGKNPYDESDYRFQLVEPTSQVLAARGMLHRTLSALAHLYNVDAKSVQFGLNNAIKVECLPLKDGVKHPASGPFRASDLAKFAQEYLVKKEWVTTRDSNKKKNDKNKNGEATTITPPAVDANTAKSVMVAMTKLFNSDKFKPKTSVAGTKRAEIEVDKHDQAEFAITCIGDIKPQDMRDDELRATMCKLFVDCGRILGMRTVSDAQKGINAETIKKIAA